jgi:hypothetical protein
MFNFALYDTKTGINIVNMEDENIASGYLFSQEGVGIRGNKELIWTTRKEALADKTIRDFSGFSPVLGKDRKINIDWGGTESDTLKQLNKRMLFGWDSKYIKICASDNSISIPTAANIMIGTLMCQFAGNCDGGGSIYLRNGDNIIRNSTRKNASWFLIYLDKLLDFIEIVKLQLGKDYIFGADGQVYTPQMLQDSIKWLGEEHYYFPGYSAEEAAENDIQDFDCSGLFVYVLRSLNIISKTTDYTAGGLFGICNEKDKSELCNGDLVFRGNPINHVGMYYNGLVIHAKGTKYGIVIADEISTFKKFGTLKSLAA